MRLRLKENSYHFTAALSAGMYWAGVLYILFPRTTDGDTPLRQVLMLTVIVAIILIAAFFHKFFVEHRVQKILALVAIISDLLEIALRCVSVFNDSGVLLVLQMSMDILSSACLTLFWGMFFAAFDKKAAERATLNTALFSFVSLGLLFCLPYEISFWIALIMKAVSTLPFLLKNEALVIINRPLREEAHGTAIVFFSARAFVGASVGVITCLVTFVDLAAIPQEHPLFGVACTMVVVALLIFITRKKGIECMPLLTTLPIVFLFGMFVLFVENHNTVYDTLQTIAIPALWLSWTILSSIQNSEMKEAIGMNEALLSFLDKGVKNLFSVIGFLAAYLFVMSVGPETIPSYIGQVSLAAVAVWLIIVTYFLVQLSNAKERGKALESTPTVEKEIEEICKIIAKDYKLSRREEEILELLARGHSQPYICELFVLAPGTVKSHVAHIYRKLNIGKRESLFTVIDKYRSKLVTRRRFGK